MCSIGEKMRFVRYINLLFDGGYSSGWTLFSCIHATTLVYVPSGRWKTGIVAYRIDSHALPRRSEYWSRRPPAHVVRYVATPHDKESVFKKKYIYRYRFSIPNKTPLWSLCAGVTSHKRRTLQTTTNSWFYFSFLHTEKSKKYSKILHKFLQTSKHVVFCPSCILISPFHGVCSSNELIQTSFDLYMILQDEYLVLYSTCV